MCTRYQPIRLKNHHFMSQKLQYLQGLSCVFKMLVEFVFGGLMAID